MTLNCIAVDDEPLALGLVCTFIEQTPFLNLVGRYTSAIEALQAVRDSDLHLIFLDIQMPELGGMELARLLGQQREGDGPRIIFTTAYNQFAIEGYKVDALDYLLKPFNYDEFLRASNKALLHFERLQQAQPAPALQSEEDSLFLKVEYQWVRVNFKDILYIEGLKDYVKVHLQGDARPLLSLTSLKALEDKLPHGRFMRLHRSYIVSLEKIDAVTRTSVQIGGMTIGIGEQYKEAFKQFLNKWMV